MASFFEDMDALTIKISPERVNELVTEGTGKEFNFTGKRFNEWVLIPLEFEEEYERFIREALAYAKSKGVSPPNSGLIQVL